MLCRITWINVKVFQVFSLDIKKGRRGFVFLGIQVTNACLQKFLVDRKLMCSEASRNSSPYNEYYLVTHTLFQACKTFFCVCVCAILKKIFRRTLLVELHLLLLCFFLFVCFIQSMRNKTLGWMRVRVGRMFLKILNFCELSRNLPDAFCHFTTLLKVSKFWHNFHFWVNITAI